MYILARGESLNILHTSFNIAVAIRNYHAGRAAVVDKSIERSFQKTRGLAFRQSEKGNYSGDKRSKYVERKGLPDIKPRVSELGRVGKSSESGYSGRSNGRSDGRPSGTLDRRDNREKSKDFAHTTNASRERDTRDGGSGWKSNGPSQFSRERGKDVSSRSDRRPNNGMRENRNRDEFSFRKPWQEDGPAQFIKDKGHGKYARSESDVMDMRSRDEDSFKKPWQNNGESEFFAGTRREGNTRPERRSQGDVAGGRSRDGGFAQNRRQDNDAFTPPRERQAWPTKGGSRTAPQYNRNSTDDEWSTTRPAKQFARDGSGPKEKTFQGVPSWKQWSEGTSLENKVSGRSPERVTPTTWESKNTDRVLNHRAPRDRSQESWAKADPFARRSQPDSDKASKFPHPNQRRLDTIGSIQSSVNGLYTRHRPESETSRPTTSTGPLSIPYTTPASQFLYGTHVIEAALSQRRRKLYRLYIQFRENRKDEGIERDAQLEHLARKRGVKVSRLGKEGNAMLDKMTRGGVHQGYVLEASPLPQLPVDSLGSLEINDELEDGFEVELDTQSKEEADINGTDTFLPSRKNAARKPLVLFLDKIVDPQNMGAIIRSAAFLGVSAVAVSNHSAPLANAAVLKASAGSTEGMTLLKVRNPASFLARSRRAGWQVYCAIAPPKKGDESDPTPTAVDDLNDPLTDAPVILVLGSEGAGLPQSLLSKADKRVYIRGRGPVAGLDSLNVSVAAGILCATINRRGKMARRPSLPALDLGDMEDENVDEEAEEMAHRGSSEELGEQVDEEDAEIEELKKVPLF